MAKPIRSTISLTIIALTVILAAQTLAQSPTSPRRAVNGTVYDADSREPIPHATVRVVGTDRSTLANDEGSFRVWLSPGETRLKISHIAYFSAEIEYVADDPAAQDVFLHTCMVDVGTMQVYSRAYDPGQRIIVEAIKRKEDILAKIHDYRYDAYTKLLVTDETKPDSSEIMLITETQVTAFWEQPDKYKEVITSRQQSANIEAENNLVTVGEILNFNKNRIELGRYSVVSPTAEDALDHYNYYLMDTVYIDSLAVFRLEVEPKNPDDPLFVGFIHIADSTYDVVQVEVGFSRGVDVSLLIDPRYSQRFAQFENEYWMPIEIRFSAGIEFEFPIPGIPNKLGFAHVASLYSYTFDAGHDDGTFGEYRIEVDREADEIDSAAWAENQTIPLTATELDAYYRIDSVENEPPSLTEIALTPIGIAALVLIAGEDDFFRFNRVEGPFVGLAAETDRLHERLRIRGKTGYALSAERSQHQIGLTYEAHTRRKLRLGVDYHNRITHRPTAVSGPDDSPTASALTDSYDPFDYYREKGWRAFASTKLVDHTRLELTYSDFDQSSLPVSEYYSFFGDSPPDSDRDAFNNGSITDIRDYDLRANPAITDGRLRSVGAEFRYDSRKMFRNKGRDVRIDDVEYFTLAVGVEYASPDFIDNDFDFRRYHLEIHRRQRTLGLGVASFRLYAGSADGDLPIQRQFTVDFSNLMLSSPESFQTMDRINFVGDRTLMMYATHQFRRRLFVASGIPLIKDIPLWLSLHGGIFWSEFRNGSRYQLDYYNQTAAKPYREFGFGLGNLTPFLTPFNMEVKFTWQLSNYDTSDFSVMFGIDL